MNALVVGGNRFIGAALVKQLLDRGYYVCVLALDAPSIDIPERIEFLQANRDDRERLCDLVRGRHFDVVFDNIALAGEQVQVLLEALDGRFGRYVLTSTVDIYPMNNAQQWHEEDALLEPSILNGAPAAEKYRRGKRACEKLLVSSAVEYSIVRPAMVTGVGDPVPPRPKFWNSLGHRGGRSLLFPSRVLDGGPILLPHSDRRIFQLAWVQDVASALILCGTHPDAANTAFNIAGDEIWSHERLAVALCRATGRLPSIVRVFQEELDFAGLAGYELPYASNRCSLVSTRRLKSIGWQPTTATYWLPSLLEAVLDPEHRPFYALRPREVALGQHTQSYKLAAVSTPSISGSEVPDRAQPSHLTLATRLSSIGIGTHRGLADDATDASYASALLLGLKHGIKLIDTAINYRNMRSERVVGQAILEHLASGNSRESVFVVTKGGYVPLDSAEERSRISWITEELIKPGFLLPHEEAARHTIRSGWMRESLRLSEANLGIDTIDGFLVHNPELAKRQLGSSFWLELTRTFAMLEEAVADGRIGCYGLALWRAARPLSYSAESLSLERAIICAETAAAGKTHHFRLLELPLNAMNLQPMQIRSQVAAGRKCTLLEAAEVHGLHVLTSASIAGAAQLSLKAKARLPDSDSLTDDYMRALQFTKSIPGVRSAIVGMRSVEHVRTALHVAALNNIPKSELEQLILRARAINS